jgi:hypothetical protein
MKSKSPPVVTVSAFNTFGCTMDAQLCLKDFAYLSNMTRSCLCHIQRTRDS